MATATVAPQETLGDNAYEAADGLGIDGAARPRTFATMVAALAYEGWKGRAADQLLGDVFGPFDASELARAKRDAQAIERPWDAWDSSPVEAAEAAEVLRRLLRQNAPATARTPEPGGVRFDLNEPPAPPRWLVPDFLVRGKTHMLSGPTHALKTGLREAMMAGSLTGQPFLGRKVPGLRWMVLDGENSRDDLTARWKALGLRNTHLTHVHLTTREANVRLGEPEWDEWLRREVERFRPDVLVLDTVVRVCAGVNSLDGDAVAALYADVLVPLVDRHDLALLFTAHHRKSGGQAGTDEAVNGTVQWSAQAEQTMTVAPTGPLALTERPDSSTDTYRPFVLRRPKGRTLVDNSPEHFEVRGRLDVRGALTEFAVVPPQSEPTTAERLIAALDSPLGTGALAQALDLNRTGDKFRTALTDAVEAGLIVKRDGRYERAG